MKKKIKVDIPNIDGSILKILIGKLSSTIYEQDHTPWSSGIYSRNARVVQYLSMRYIVLTKR